MGQWLNVRASDGVELSAYKAVPEAEIRGGLVVVQEIYGVNQHVQSVVDSYAEQGYVAIAPALFDRIERGVQLRYSGEDTKKAFELYGKLNPEKALLDVAAAFKELEGEGPGAGVLGFCYGGLMAWLSTTRGATEGIEPRCAVGYYAGGIGKVANEEPKCPVMLHFGAEDSHIGAEQVDAVRVAHPEVQVFVYEGAGHAFNRDADPNSYHPAAAEEARQRTLAFLREHIG